MTAETAARLVCVPAQDLADELVGHMLAQLVGRGVPPAVLEYDLPRPEVLSRLAELGAEQVFVSVLAPYSFTQVREICRDLRAHFPGMRIVVALWDLRAEAERFRQRLASAGADEVVATLKEAVRAIRTSPARTFTPPVLVRELGQAFHDGDLPRAETLLDQAEPELSLETLAFEVLRPVVAGLRRDVTTGRLTAAGELAAHDLLRGRLILLGEAPVQAAQEYRALAVSAPGEEQEIGALILTLLLRQAGWSVVQIGQLPDEGLAEAIGSVRPHVVLLSAGLTAGAGRLLELAAGIHRDHPDLLIVFEGPGFRSPAVTRMAGAALLAGADVRKTLAEIDRRLPPRREEPAPQPSSPEPGEEDTVSLMRPEIRQAS
jgi:methanogenic corrinoid protein MtbC1